MPRAFIALDLPDEALGPLEAATRGLPCGRVTPPENLHLTLAFLDEQPMMLLESLHECLTEIRPSAPTVTVTGLDLWGAKVPELLVATVAPSEPLERLRAAVARAVREVGIDLSRRRFRPHVTLARFRREDSTDRLRAWLAGRAPLARIEVRSTGFTLWRSILQKDGAVHDPLAEYPLA